MQFIEDGAVPPARLADYVRGVRAALDSRCVRGVIFGHAGDAHVHVNPLIDVRRPGWREMFRVFSTTSSLSRSASAELFRRARRRAAPRASPRRYVARRRSTSLRAGEACLRPGGNFQSGSESAPPRPAGDSRREVRPGSSADSSSREVRARFCQLPRARVRDLAAVLAD